MLAGDYPKINETKAIQMDPNLLQAAISFFEMRGQNKAAAED
jgi:hypothetical protein